MSISLPPFGQLVAFPVGYLMYRGFWGGASTTWEKDDRAIPMCGLTFPFTLNGGFQIWDQFIPMMLGFRTHAADTGG